MRHGSGSKTPVFEESFWICSMCCLDDSRVVESVSGELNSSVNACKETISVNNSLCSLNPDLLTKPQSNCCPVGHLVTVLLTFHGFFALCHFESQHDRTLAVACILQRPVKIARVYMYMACSSTYLEFQAVRLWFPDALGHMRHTTHIEVSIFSSATKKVRMKFNGMMIVFFEIPPS